VPLLRLIAAVVVPPLGAFLARGITMSFWLCCGLTLLGWIPGMICAIYLVVTTRD